MVAEEWRDLGGKEFKMQGNSHRALGGVLRLLLLQFHVDNNDGDERKA